MRLSEGPPVGSHKTARILRCRATFCELVHLCNMVERCPRTSTSESTLFSENADPFRQRAVAGDSDAFITLLNQYSRHIYRLGVSITGNHHDAEDVLQEASLKAYTALAEFQGNSRFYTWLVRIAVNVALGKLRKRALWKESSLDEPREGEDGWPRPSLTVAVDG